VRLAEKFGYIGTSGKIAIAPQFISAGDFHEGLATAKLGNKYGYIDKCGRVKINPQFDAAGDFSDGVAPIAVAGRWGYIDKSAMLSTRNSTWGEIFTPGALLFGSATAKGISTRAAGSSGIR